MEAKDGTITKVEIQKKNPNRINVYIDDEFAFACSAELIYTYGIHKGEEIKLKDISALIEEDNYVKSKEYSLKFMEKAYKTEAQVRGKLLEKGYDSKTIDRTISFLKNYEFLNDERFVKAYCSLKIKTEGKNKIKYNLVNKGVSEDLINKALSSMNSSKEQEAAILLAEKKYSIIVKSEKDYRKIYKKLGDYLYRKGYAFEIIEKTLKLVLKSGLEQNLEKAESVSEDIEDNSRLQELAEKRYNIILKSEKDSKKICKKLGDYLLRRGYKWEDIKRVLKVLIEDCYI